MNEWSQMSLSWVMTLLDVSIAIASPCTFVQYGTRTPGHGALKPVTGLLFALLLQLLLTYLSSTTLSTASAHTKCPPRTSCVPCPSCYSYFKKVEIGADSE